MVSIVNAILFFRPFGTIPNAPGNMDKSCKIGQQVVNWATFESKALLNFQMTFFLFSFSYYKLKVTQLILKNWSKNLKNNPVYQPCLL